MFDTASLAEWARLWRDELRQALAVLLIVAGGLVARWALMRLVRHFYKTMEARAASPEDAKWIGTVGRVLRQVISIGVLLVILMLVLNQFGVSIAPILGAAGVVGIAVGFGAQSLIKDYFNGFFLLVENQIRVGDAVQIADKSGLVEEVTLRRVKLRDYDGSVHYIPNGQITIVTNRSTEFAFALIEAGIAYKENIDAALDVLRKVGAELRADPAFGPKILEDLDVAGVERWEDSAIVLRCRFKVLPLEQWNVRREFLRRLKAAFDAAGIEIPFPHRTIYFGDPNATAVFATAAQPSAAHSGRRTG
ncbi:MAG TPA: mechanosensitive ion channel family protein [Burkholderiaceae bacterium]|jgi:small conductance mechanosensitive channel|nr:mechanosensitive ion channel family protein [Burkholderiaceae bacterium]